MYAIFMTQVVKTMPYIIKVDKQGRLVLPKEVREKAGIKENSQLIYTVIGGDRTHPII